MIWTQQRGHPWSEVSFEQFPNRETRVERIEVPLTAPIVHFRYESDADLIRLLFVARHLEGIRERVLYVHYMPYSRMDRVKSTEQVFTLKYIADFINSLGFERVYVVEPHSDVTCAVLNNAQPFWVMQYLLDCLPLIYDNERDYVVYPDTGAAKRYEGLVAPDGASFKNVLIGNKHRDFNTGRIVSLDLMGDTPGEEISWEGPSGALIIDDLSSYGGTFVQTAKVLRSKNITGPITLVVAHAEDVILKGELFHYIDHVVCTDSLNPPTHRRLHVVSLEEIL